MNSQHFVLAIAMAASFVPCQVPNRASAATTEPVRARTAAPRVHPEELSPVIVPIHSQVADPEGGEYGIWAAGADYKVAFGDGVKVVPFLGPDYPDSQPFGWRTESVRCGELELATATPAGRRATDRRYEYDLGGVVEAYDVRLEGVEQTFVITRRPLATGDLVVRGRVETGLVAPRRPARHAPLVFRDRAGRAILEYGAATAVDARGLRLPMTTSFDDGVITLRLDREQLDGAVFPLVVDPLIGPNVTLNTMSTFNGTARHFDVIREGSSVGLDVWVCYTRYASATDEDLWLRRTGDNLPGALVVQVFADLSTSWSTRTCQLAAEESRVICAFVRHFATTTNIRWHAHHVDNLGSDTSVGFWSASTNNWRVDIGGESSRAFLVYQHEPTATFSASPVSEIRGFYLDSFGTGTVSQGTASAEVTVSTNSNVDHERPHVPRQGDFDGNQWMWPIVYQAYVNGTPVVDDWDLICDLFDDDGNKLDWLPIEPVNGAHKLGPDIAGADGEFVVTYATADTGLVNFKTGTVVGYDVKCQRVRRSGQSLSLPFAATSILGGSQRQFEVGGIAFEKQVAGGGRWLLISRAGDVVWADILGYRGRTVTYELFYSGSSSIIEYGGAAAWDADNRQFVLVGSQSGTGNPLFGNVWRYPAVAAPVTGGVSCSSASLFWQRPYLPPFLPWLAGSQRIGTRGSGVRISGAPPSTLAVLAASAAPANLLLPPGGPFGTQCRLLIDSGPANFFGLLDPLVVGSGGEAFWPVPLPGNLPPMDLHYQVLHLDPTSTVLWSTVRLSVPIDV